MLGICIIFLINFYSLLNSLYSFGILGYLYTSLFSSIIHLVDFFDVLWHFNELFISIYGCKSAGRRTMFFEIVVKRVVRKNLNLNIF